MPKSILIWDRTQEDSSNHQEGQKLLQSARTGGIEVVQLLSAEAKAKDDTGEVSFVPNSAEGVFGLSLELYLRQAGVGHIYYLGNGCQEALFEEGHQHAYQLYAFDRLIEGKVVPDYVQIVSIGKICDDFTARKGLCEQLERFLQAVLNQDEQALFEVMSARFNGHGIAPDGPQDWNREEYIARVLSPQGRELMKDARRTVIHVECTEREGFSHSRFDGGFGIFFDRLVWFKEGEDWRLRAKHFRHRAANAL